MPNGSPSAKELIVKAQYFLPIEPKEEHLRKIQNKLTKIMMQEGYRQTDVDLDLFGPVQRTMDFILLPPPPEKSFWEKFTDWFNNGRSRRGSSLDRDDFLDGLSRVRDDLPFRLTFRFKTFDGEELEGYDLFIESTPVLLQKYRQLELPENYGYSTENIVNQNSREVQRIMGRFELEPLQGPYTEAQTLETRLSNSAVEKFGEHQYGQTAIQYINEGDQCLQQNLLNAALSCYIQGIEWTILYYKVITEEEDLIQQQQDGEIDPVFFKDLIDEIEGTQASQKTISKLNNFNNAERRWIAHHKSGTIEQQDVENVRSTLLRLTDELL